MKYSTENIEECYSPRIEALIKDWDVWMNNGGGYYTYDQFWTAAEAVHGITRVEFSSILDARLKNFHKIISRW
jgi:hypothetical protein